MKRKLLIVEDEPELLQMLSLKANHLNYDCVLEASGELSIDKAKFFNPDVILLDLNLPKISGLGVIRELKRINQTANIPIIVYSAIHDSEVVREAMDLGATAYVTKTSGMKDLFSLVTEYTAT